MRKLLIGLLALGSISSFASTVKVTKVSLVQDQKIHSKYSSFDKFGTKVILNIKGTLGKSTQISDSVPSVLNGYRYLFYQNSNQLLAIPNSSYDQNDEAVLIGTVLDNGTVKLKPQLKICGEVGSSASVEYSIDGLDRLFMSQNNMPKRFIVDRCSKH